jgi:indolepyruvate ferredoxin oxidoreductase
MNAPIAPLLDVTLDDKYMLERGRAFMTGTQALVRLMLLQRDRDLRAGLNTGGFVSGYRGSPLGGLDQALWKAKAHLEAHHVVFQPGVNEDLAATSIWGTQQVNLFPGAKYDGVFAMWYGKGPGVDRCGDVFKHANAAGTWKHGGVLVLAGDDHAAKSSTLAHQSEHILKACLIPVLHPANVQEYLDLGLHGFAMSRFSGCWVSFKCVTDTVESGASVVIDPERVPIVLPQDFAMPPGGLNIRWPDGILEQEARLLDFKVYAALAYVRANRLDRTVWDSPRARFGIVTTGKSYGDTMQALADLGIDARVAHDVGIRVYKVAMPWPLEPTGIRRFSEGLEEILVVEEKRQLIEYQLKEELYNWREDVRAPRVVGKFDDNGEWSVHEGKPAGNWLLPAHYELSPAMVTKAIAQRLERLGLDRAMGDRYRERLAFLAFKERVAQPAVAANRQPYFCSGCPHNTSTRVPEGSRAMAGIGCHFMALWMDRNTATFTHMGGEGAPWIGQQPFTNEKHVFANLGDGTYFHSGLMAIRAAVAAKVNITYKILYNDAVAMTGGQHHDGPLDPAMISRQIAAEGVRPVIVVTDEPEKYPTGYRWAEGVTVRHRDDLDAVQRELRGEPGVSAIIYDQTCASEKRRRRKRNEYPDPPKRVFINEMVCEGCGDCSVKSNCLSVEPLETELGRKRRINQSTCNKDYSCVNGFCPSFVTVHGGALRKGKAQAKSAGLEMPPVPAPEVPVLDAPFGVLVTGIGGTGVVTIGQILAMAAHLEGKGVSVLDMSGLAQKGGPVMSHVKLASHPEDLHAVRLGTGAADLVLGCDLIVTSGAEALAKMAPRRTRVVLNASVAPTAEFVKNPNWTPPKTSLEAQVAAACGGNDAVAYVPAGKVAINLLGDAIATNMFVLGYAFQKGWLPLAEGSIVRAIELNGVAVDFNRKAFSWGRRAAHDFAAVERLAMPTEVIRLTPPFAKSLDEIVARRIEHLTGYQNAAYAERYRRFVERVREAEARLAPGASKLAEAVARNYAKLLAYKDEYEVARLYADPAFEARLRAEFEGDFRLRLHLAPPLLAKTDPRTGEPKKREYGAWVLGAMRVLARFKFLRGSALDPFGRTEERRLERQLIADYERIIEELLAGLTRDNHATAVALAALPEEIRGFGHVKLRHLEAAKAKEAKLLAAFRAPAAPARAA